jgi:hypothetical protein
MIATDELDMMWKEVVVSYQNTGKTGEKYEIFQLGLKSSLPRVKPWTFTVSSWSVHYFICSYTFTVLH